MEDIQISSPLVWSEIETENILVGKILANKMYSRSAMESILCKAWNLQSGFEITEITGNAFLFKFKHKEDYNRILRGRPWSVNGTLLNLRERSKYKAYDEFDFSRCPIWIQIHNVPLEALCLANAITIGGHVGEVILAEDPFYNGRYLRNFLRTRVMLDLRKPLAYGFWLPKPDGRKTWISIKYEKLQTFCYKCGKIGHDNRVCHSEKMMSCFKPEEPRYGAWLSTTVCRSWDETLVALNMDEVEAQFVRRKREEAEKRKEELEKMKANTETATTDDDLFCIRINDPVSVAQKRGIEEVRRGKERITEVFPEDVINKRAIYSRRQDVQGSRGGASNTSASTEELRVEGKPEEIISDMAKSNLLVGDNTMAKADTESSLALVIYDGCAMKEVLNGINSLGLKREAAEDWDSSESKWRRCEEKRSNPLTDISNYASNLRKAKAKVVREAEEVTRELEEAWAHEEVYWWQRSRISWLKCGDKNTKFFHNNVIQRRQRNKVLRLKEGGGSWLEDRGEINEAFNAFYQKLFSSVGARQIEQAVSYVDWW
ncbi:hypothetical protein K1719_008925 [Acacia pycnantha]|nr:hypothetical protein K1719_008925 [Acacia pycnantha]